MPRTTAKPKKPAKGVRITKGSKWKLVDSGGKLRDFAATVMESWVVGGKRIVLLSVPARVRETRKPRTKKKP
jgi:hypothetical protein